jgi:hypothetical protein
MSLELWTAVATIGTFVVLAAGTVAALIQLTHLRANNQMQALIELGHELQRISPHIAFVYYELPQKMKDPEFRREVGVVIDPERHPELLVAIFLDRCGMLVKLNLMPERFIMEYSGGVDAVLKAWTNLEDVIAIRRRELPNAYQDFEFLAVRARKWHDRFPHGTYPSSEPRIPLNDRWSGDKHASKL